MSVHGGFKSGFLNKASMSTGRNWKKRYFLLSGPCISYFESDAKGVLIGRSKGDLVLDPRTTLRTGPSDSRQLCLFVTIDPQQVLIIECATLSELNEWKKMITYSISATQIGTRAAGTGTVGTDSQNG